MKLKIVPVGLLTLLTLSAVCAMPKPAWAQNADSKDLKRLPSGKLMIWEDRGAMTPERVFWGVGDFSDMMGAAQASKSPETRLPAPPFTKFEDTTESRTSSPKGKLTDNNGAKWTAKWGVEVHADIAASRLAWAMGYGVEEMYYVPAGKIDGIKPGDNLKYVDKYLQPDSSFTEARFKRKGKENGKVKGEKDEDVLWDYRNNPGVPDAQFSGLKILNVLVHNWDAQPKNNKILRVERKSGPENWIIVSDWGASFGDMKSKWNFMDYRKETGFVKEVKDGYVYLNFRSAIQGQGQTHEKIPLADAQWFRAQLAKLTDAEILAAFNAAYATPELIAAYHSGDEAQVEKLTTRTPMYFAGAFRARVAEFLSKVPASAGDGVEAESAGAPAPIPAANPVAK